MKFFNSFNSCPNCGSKQIIQTKLGYPNRYLEEISKYLRINEKELNSQSRNVKCINCNLIYKKKWFKKKYLESIFIKLIPTHPKGWDKLSKKFNKLNFSKLIKSLIKIIQTKNYRYLPRKIREINSLVDSIDNKLLKTELKNDFNKSIENEKIHLISKYSQKIKREIKKPAEFSRFKGFESLDLISHIEKKVGQISSYAEIGCPLWGNLDYFNKLNRECFFVKAENFEFWGKNCKKNNIKCLSKLNKDIKKIHKLSNLNFKTKKDFIGIFLYLDHVIDPKKFFFKIFKNFKSCGIILEKSNKGVPIQHFSGWSEKALKFLSREFGKKLDCTYKELSKTGKNFYLIY